MGVTLHVLNPIQKSCTAFSGPQTGKVTGNVGSLIVPEYETDGVGVFLSGLGGDKVYFTFDPYGEEEEGVDGGEMYYPWEFESLG